MKLLIFYALFFSFNVYNSGIPVDERLEATYADAKSYYPSWETVFLPDLRSGRLIFFRVSNPVERSRGHIHIIMKLPDEELREVQNMAYSGSIRRSFNDSELMILDRNPRITHFRNLDMSREIDDVPIPNFDFIQDNMFTSSYIDRATIFVYGYARRDSRAGEPPTTDLPERWNHGMTSGVVIWDNYVAYWLDVW